MTYKVSIVTLIETDKGHSVEIKGVPEKCPYCHKSIIPIILTGHLTNDNALEVLTVCPSEKCSKSFISYYFKVSDEDFYGFSSFTSSGNIERKTFNEAILIISPDFIEIYNEAYQAEQQNLLKVCGVGYRKALEFLIKDYLTLNKPSDKDKIIRKQLGSCITEYVDDSKIKSVAIRAAWLGNDETHYFRKWEGKDLNDLKKLIDLTVHWIEAEVITKSFEEEMPG